MEHCQNSVNKMKSWTFLNKECEQIRPPSLQTEWLITTAAVQLVWRRVNNKRKSKYLENQNLNYDALENTFGAICLQYGSSCKPSVRQFVDVLKTVIINGLDYRGLLDPKCGDVRATLLHNLYSFLKPSSVSSPSPSTSHCRETTNNVLYIVDVNKVQEGVLTAICVGDEKMLLVAFVSDFISSHLLCDGRCDACKAYLIFEALSPTGLQRLQGVQQ